MANFPTYPQAEGTFLMPRSAVRNRYATNLRVRPRGIATSSFYDPTVIWVGLSASNFATFITFYETNKAITFTYTHQPTGASMTCVFDDARPFDPPRAYLAGPGVILYDVKVYLRQAA